MTGQPAYPNTALWPAATGLYPSDAGEVAPTCITGAATSVTTTSVILNGTVDPNGLQTTYYFEYGWGPDPFGNQSTDGDAGAGAVGVAVSTALLSLTSARHYHYRLVAYSAAGFAYGDGRTFNTDFGHNDPRPGHVHTAGRGQ